MKTCCIVVIGHVDHGKTSLVRALTGIETDRLTEEKSRGLSITPGFAHRKFPAGVLDFIDVPGHEDFIQAMVSGATGARAALLVISAVEGIAAQTLEHLNIARLLGVSGGVIAVTKSDLLDTSQQSARLAEIRSALSGTLFCECPMVLCSATTGHAMETLNETLAGLLSKPPEAAPLQSYLPIDRVFSVAGLGTVVTGTLLGRDLTLDAEVVLLPEKRKVTLRGLQSRGEPRERVQVGERVAANLRGVAVADVSRGAVLCVGRGIAPSNMIDIALEVLPTTDKPLRHMEEIRVLFGTSSEVASLRLFGGGRPEDGQTGLGQLRFKKSVVGYAGQRAILRRLSPAQTIAGAEFLDPNARAVKSKDPLRLGVLLAAQSGVVAGVATALSKSNDGVISLSDVARLSRKPSAFVRNTLVDGYESIDDDWMVSTDQFEKCKAGIVAALSSYHADNPLKAMAPPHVVAGIVKSSQLLNHAQSALLASGHIVQQDTRFAIRGHDPAKLLTDKQRARMAQIEEIFKDSDLAPPSVQALIKDPLEADLFALLIDAGQLVSVHNVSLKQTLVFHRNSLAEAATRLGAIFPPPGQFTTSQARAALGTSRRIIVPVLEYFDTQGTTIRHENLRQLAAANSVPPLGSTC